MALFTTNRIRGYLARRAAAPTQSDGPPSGEPDSGGTLLAGGCHPVLIRAGQSLGETGQPGAAVGYHPHQPRRPGPMARTRRRPRRRCHGVGGSAGRPAAHAWARPPRHRRHRHVLAYWRGRAGDNAAAHAFRSVLADRIRVLGPDHPRTLLTRRELAACRALASDPTSALADLRTVLADALRLLGPHHTYTLSIRLDLLRFTDWTADPAGAVHAGEALVADYLRAVGPDHPHTLEARFELTRHHWNTGDTAAATIALHRLLADQVRVLGTDHPRTLLTRHRLACWQGHAESPTAAVNALTAVLAHQISTLSPHHPYLTDTRRDLAYWQRQTARPTGARHRG